MTLDEQIEARLKEIGYEEAGAGDLLVDCFRAGHLVVLAHLPNGSQFINAFPVGQVGTLADLFPGLVSDAP